MTITVTASGISLDGPLVAGEVVAVSVSGVTFAEDAKPTLCLLGRFPDALLSSVELAEDENTPGTWTGQLDTATKQTAVFFATARADECRDAVLELVAARQSVARLMVAFRNSALCPSPFHAPDASPVYVPVPGPPGQGGDPYDQNPAMDGTASAGASDEYARGDHVHPTDTSRASAADVTAIQSLIPSNASSSNKLATAEDIPSGQVNADWTATSGPAEILHKPNLAAVATSGDYADLTNKPTIPAAQVQSDWNETDTSSKSYIQNKPTIPGPAPVSSVNGETGDVELYGSTLLMSPGDTTIVSAAVGDAQWDATRALSEIAYKADSAALAPAFSSSSTYAVGDYVTREGLLYKCSTAVTTAGAWDATKWTAVAVTDEMGADTPLPFDAEVEYLQVGDGSYDSTKRIMFETGIYLSSYVDLHAEVYIPAGPILRAHAEIGKYTDNWQYMLDASENILSWYKGGNNQRTTVTGVPVGEWFTLEAKGNNYILGASSGTAAKTLGYIASETIHALVKANARLRSVRVSLNGYPIFDGVPVRVGQVGFLYDNVTGSLVGADASSTAEATPGPDKATPTITTPDRLVEIDERNNYLAIDSTTTLAPETAVYRATATLSGTTATMPTVTITGIPTAAAYFAFELEVAVDATATALDDTAWSGWTWMDGGELPTSDYAGKTLFIACRLDCTARTIVANCYDVR